MIVSKNELGDVRAQANNTDQTVALRFGTYDLLHAGHKAGIIDAAGHANLLVVGIMPDEYVSRVKGPNRPINPEQRRIQTIDEADGVDFSFIAPPRALGIARAILSLRPNVYVEDEEQEIGKLKSLLLGAVGTEYITTPRNEGGSTTDMISLLGLDEAIHRSSLDFTLQQPAPEAF
jgi:cytidyltransferase-like protein